MLGSAALTASTVSGPSRSAARSGTTGRSGGRACRPRQPPFPAELLDDLTGPDRPDEEHTLNDRPCGRATGPGLLAEESHPGSGASSGDSPRASGHVRGVSSGWTPARAEEG